MAVGTVSGAPGSGQNPFSQFGTPPGGVQADPNAQPVPDVAAVVAENQALRQRIEQAEGKLSKLPENFEGLTKRLGVVDSIIKAIQGETGEPENAATYRNIFRDLKEVARVAAPGFYKAMQILEADPQAIDKLTQGLDGMAIQQITRLNEQAHGEVMRAAKSAGLTKGLTDAEVAAYVYPFETAITSVINGNPELRRAFLGGRVDVVHDIFKQIAQPQIAQRLRAKAAAVNVNRPTAPPRGGAEPGATADSATPQRLNLRNPRDRMAFHKQAVGRWLDKASGRDDE